MSKLIVKSLSSKDRKNYKRELLSLYDPCNKRNKEYIKSFTNSKFIVVALLDEKIVWAVRIITDLFMSALIIDLYVDESLRWKWIWTKVMIKAIKICVDNKIKNIELIADPNDKWLKLFYEKLWFLNSEENWLYMSFNKNNI